MKTLDIMLDLETFGLGNAPVIIQFSAVPFNILTGETFEPFNKLVKPQSCAKLGMSVTGSTIEWWLKQEDSVISSVFMNALANGSDIVEVLAGFSEYIKELKEVYKVEDVRIWGNGLLADNKWMESAYELAKLKMPVKYWESSDVRTLVDLGIRLLNFDPKTEMKFEGEKHNAIDDCKHQIKYCSAIYKKLGEVK